LRKVKLKQSPQLPKTKKTSVASRRKYLFTYNSDNNNENEDDFASSEAMEAAVNAKLNINDVDTTDSSSVKVVVKLKSAASFFTNIHYKHFLRQFENNNDRPHDAHRESYC
jgi:hypothetical protein